MKLFYTLSTMHIKQLLQQGLEYLRAKSTAAAQSNDRAVSPSTVKHLRCVAHQRCNGYDPILNYERRFGTIDACS